MDDQRQFGGLSGLDMDAQGLLLHLCAFDGVMIIQSRLTNGHKFRMCSQGNQLINRDHRLFVGIHRVGASGIKNRCIGLCNPTDIELLTQSCANRHHALHADLLGPCDNIV